MGEDENRNMMTLLIKRSQTHTRRTATRREHRWRQSWL